MPARGNNQCTAVAKKTGRQCEMPALRGSNPQLCWNHSPTTAKAAKAARRKAGRRNRVKAGSPADVLSIDSLQQHLAQALGDLKAHENSIQKANAIRGVVLAARTLIEDSETKVLLEEIKDELAQQRKQQS